MKAIFVFNARYYVDDSGQIFTEGKFPYSVWERYLQYFDELIVVGRSFPIGLLRSQDLNISSGPKVQFVFVPNLCSPIGMFRHRSAVINTLHSLISSVDAVIARADLLSKLAAPIAKKLEIPYAVEVVGCAWDAYWNYGAIRGRLMAPIGYYSHKKMLAQAPYAIYVTRNFLQKRYPCYGITSYASNVELPEPDDAVLTKRLHKIARPASDSLVFGLIGTLQTKYKGIQTALSAFSQLKHQLPDFELQILGEGDREPWKQLAESLGLGNNVRFLGLLPAGAPVLKWLDTIDVYLQPSLTEGLPRALVEAMSRACPAVASTAGGIPELLEPSVLHKTRDVEGVSELILNSLSPQWRKEQAVKNFETSKQYTRKVLSARREEFWEDFAAYARTCKENESII